MDPNANLAEQRQIAENAPNMSDEERADAFERLSDLVLALDAWIAGGGFLPARCARK